MAFCGACDMPTTIANMLIDELALIFERRDHDPRVRQVPAAVPVAGAPPPRRPRQLPPPDGGSACGNARRRRSPRHPLPRRSPLPIRSRSPVPRRSRPFRQRSTTNPTRMPR